MKFLVLMGEPDHVDRWDASSDAEQQPDLAASVAWVGAA